ncbi:dimethyl sulfoxide reductase anchor subunit family protein [Brevibacillus sp. SYSU BS000544]|uniref:dimethyl sulfoxide reductase anchor subunit family protein n=1 Tax=Brevibacillus sp. SYSU BS000544 TaxID=3416443 RepID=UPI003CE56940
MHEWALLFFTLMMQAAIGGMCMLWLFQFKLAKTVSQDVLFATMKKPLMTVAILSLVGMAASTIHLGTPTHAFYTISNLGTSWLSREILFTGMFIFGTLITLYLSLKNKQVPGGLALATALIGLADVFVMSSLYTHTFVNGWNSLNTYGAFYGTTLILGSVLVASFMTGSLKTSNRSEASQEVTRYSFYAALIGLVLELVLGVIYGFSIPAPEAIQATPAVTLLEYLQPAVLIRYLLAIVGVGFMGFLAAGKSVKNTTQVAYLALAIVFVAEFIGRYVFYTLGA